MSSVEEENLEPVMHVYGRRKITSTRVQHWGSVHCCLMETVANMPHIFV